MNMKDKYTIYTEPDGEQWISAPNNGGELSHGDIVEELNRLYSKNKAYAKIIEGYEKEIQNLKNCLINCKHQLRTVMDITDHWDLEDIDDVVDERV